MTLEIKKEVVEIESQNCADQVAPKEKKSGPRHVCRFEGCGASFSRAWRLEAHISVHTGKKPFPCDVEGCNKAYTNRPHLKRHQRYQHSDKPPTVTHYPCLVPSCGIVLKTRQNLIKHNIRAHGEKKFKCPHCEQSFAKQNQLNAHTFTHTGVAPLFCSICNVGFLVAQEFHRHKRKHVLHMCPHKTCGKVFTCYNDLRRHRVKDHPKSFQCYHCQKEFKSKWVIRGHIEKVHLSERPLLSKILYQCDECSRIYASKKYFLKHMLEAHNIYIDPKIRTERKDKGVPKGPVKCLASVLSSVELPLEVNKMILQKETQL